MDERYLRNPEAERQYQTARRERAYFNEAGTDQASPAEDYFAGKDAILKQMQGQDLHQAPAPTAFGEILRRVHVHTDRVHRATDTLEVIGNRVMGSLPQDTIEKEGVKISPDGTLDHTLLALNRLDTIFARLEAATMRLELL